jgi:SAM-dependent methyltransferase
VNESGILLAALKEKLKPGRRSLLDLGIGGGHHLAPIASEFEAAGVDLSAEMLAHSRKLNPSVEHHLGDMRTVRLEQKFDAVLIHDAVSYLLTESDLRATLSNARDHLKPGGVLIMCPDWFKEDFPDGFVYHEKHSMEETDLTYIEYIHDPDPADTAAEVIMFILIKETGQLQIEQDCHTVGLFPKSTWLDLMATAGFTVEERPYVKAVFGKELVLLVGELETGD